MIASRHWRHFRKGDSVCVHMIDLLLFDPGFSHRAFDTVAYRFAGWRHTVFFALETAACSSDCGEDICPSFFCVASTLKNKCRGSLTMNGSIAIPVKRATRFGRITFAILNHGLPVGEARRKQDAFLNLVLREAGARPLAYERPAGRALSLAQIR